ncbi:uncharacterized protein SAPINGB_P002292 [Magnusiomyces paraingens]|uniref:Uncharacterized protein n=1 Tax=Magnusiomyces paraingens TaxID=2606893 RepID=A0A5E8BD58_9ASCO|nr:uncharacterized protein SAPINGB_P002292 [Saprochaete ingens]VVT49484.1 unnamed protein product [Saprochaete ingens]
MAAEQRKRLEKLMGADALDPQSSSRKHHVNLHNPRICRSFLVGTCPHDLFVGTKQDLGPCPKQHLENYKMEYRAQILKKKKFPEFDLDYERDLERYITECNRRIDTANKRLERTPEDIAKMQETTQDLEELDKNLALALEEVELLGEAGEIAKAAEVHEVMVEPLRQKRAQKERELRMLSDQSGFSGHQKLQVCTLCGAYLSRLDNDRRLADHFTGKMHLGYRLMRQAYKEIKAKNDLRRRTTGGGSSNSGATSSSGTSSISRGGGGSYRPGDQIVA